METTNKVLGSPASEGNSASTRQDPFCSFMLCVINQEQDATHSVVSRLCADLGMSYVQQDRWGGKLILAQQGAVSRAESPAVLPTIMSGVANVESKLVWGSSPSTPYGALASGELVGNYVIIRDGGHSISVATDYFGLCHIFYYRSSQLSLVSNDYGLIVRTLRRLGYAIKINSHRLAALTVGDSAFFHQPCGSHMDVEGVFDVPFDKYVKVVEGRVELFDKKAVTSALNNQGYGERSEALWERAIAEILSNVEAVLSGGARPVLDLTGGLDSRVCLAALLRRGSGLEEVFINTREVPGSEDLDIACGLVNLYEGQFDARSDFSYAPRTIDEALDSWLSHFSGLYYRLGLSAWAPVSAPSLPTRIAGGCGEVYRRFWSKVYHRQMGGVTCADGLADMLIAAEPSSSRFSREHVEMARNYISESISSIEGRNVVDKFDRHYINYRNRCHFGLREYSFRSERPVWFPLMSPALLKISNSGVSRLQDGDSVLYELLQRLNPLLARLPYDNGFRGLSSLRPDAFSSVRLSLDKSRAGWDLAGSTRKRLVGQGRPRMGAEFNLQWREVRARLYDRCLSALDETLSASGGASVISCREYRNYLSDLYTNSSPRFMVVAAKILSLTHIMRLT